MCKVVLLFFILTFVVFGCFASTSESLYKGLMHRYVKDMKPEGTVSVSLNPSLIRIMNYENHIITADVWLNHRWNDKRLKWDPSNFDNISSLVIPSDRLWKPDILFYNNAGPDTGIKYNNLNAIVAHDGGVHYIPPMRLMSQCEEEGCTQKTVNCSWEFGSWTHSGQDIEIEDEGNGISLSDYEVNPQYEIIHTASEKKTSYYSCCPDTPYMKNVVTVEFKKKY